MTKCFLLSFLMMAFVLGAAQEQTEMKFVGLKIFVQDLVDKAEDFYTTIMGLQGLTKSSNQINLESRPWRIVLFPI